MAGRQPPFERSPKGPQLPTIKFVDLSTTHAPGILPTRVILEETERLLDMAKKHVIESKQEGEFKEQIQLAQKIILKFTESTKHGIVSFENYRYLLFARDLLLAVLDQRKVKNIEDIRKHISTDWEA